MPENGKGRDLRRALQISSFSSTLISSISDWRGVPRHFSQIYFSLRLNDLPALCNISPLDSLTTLSQNPPPIVLRLLAVRGRGVLPVVPPQVGAVRVRR